MAKVRVICTNPLCIQAAADKWLDLDIAFRDKGPPACPRCGHGVLIAGNTYIGPVNQSETNLTVQERQQLERLRQPLGMAYNRNDGGSP